MKHAKEFERARILVAKYGDFASKRLATVTPQIQSRLTHNGWIELPPSYNTVFGDPCPGVKKALLIVWTVNNRSADTGIHWGIVGENDRRIIKLYKRGFNHYVNMFPGGVYGDFASGKFKDVRPVFAQHFKLMNLPCPNYNALFGDPAPGIRKALVIFYSGPLNKTMNISGENELQMFCTVHPANEILQPSFRM